MSVQMKYLSLSLALIVLLVAGSYALIKENDKIAIDNTITEPVNNDKGKEAIEVEVTEEVTDEDIPEEVEVVEEVREFPPSYFVGEHSYYHITDDKQHMFIVTVTDDVINHGAWYSDLGGSYYYKEIMPDVFMMYQATSKPEKGQPALHTWEDITASEEAHSVFSYYNGNVFMHGPQYDDYMNTDLSTGLKYEPTNGREFQEIYNNEVHPYRK